MTIREIPILSLIPMLGKDKCVYLRINEVGTVKMDKEAAKELGNKLIKLLEER